MFDLTLTFDNGPEPETTPFVLDVLARRSIRTTFFVVGHKLSTPKGRVLARRAHEEGHWIGNHTWSHSVPLGLLKDPSAIGKEIRNTQEAIGGLAHPHRYFRPFGQGGNLDERLLNPVVLGVLAAERMSCVLWNAIPGGRKVDISPQKDRKSSSPAVALLKPGFLLVTVVIRPPRRVYEMMLLVCRRLGKRFAGPT